MRTIARRAWVRSRPYEEYSGYWRGPAAWCSGHKAMRPVAEFSKNKSEKCGLHEYCKKCCALNKKRLYDSKKNAEKCKEWYWKNREQQLVRNRARYAKMREAYMDSAKRFRTEHFEEWQERTREWRRGIVFISLSMYNNHVKKTGISLLDFRTSLFSNPEFINTWVNYCICSFNSALRPVYHEGRILTAYEKQRIVKCAAHPNRKKGIPPGRPNYHQRKRQREIEFILRETHLFQKRASARWKYNRQLKAWQEKRRA